MFDTNDRNMIMQLINGSKDPQAYVVPLYVRVFKDRFPLTEMDQITTYSPSGMRIGFGAKISVFERKSFPQECMFQYDCITAFSNHDEENQADEKFIIIESGEITDDELNNEKLAPIIRELNTQIAYYYNMINEYLQTQYAEIKKRRLEALMASMEQDNSDEK